MTGRASLGEGPRQLRHIPVSVGSFSASQNFRFLGNGGSDSPTSPRCGGSKGDVSPRLCGNGQEFCFLDLSRNCRHFHGFLVPSRIEAKVHQFAKIHKLSTKD